MFIGLLSGTSMDSIDAGLWDLSSPHQAKLIHSYSQEIDPSLKQALLKLSHEGNCSLIELGTLDRRMGHLFAQAVIHLLEESGIPKSRIQAIGSHGQTLWHQPLSENPFTMQIGDPNIIAQTTDLVTIADFRRADMALGGQGAPLVPAFHDWLFHSDRVNRVIVNIGGIANLSILAKDRSLGVMGYDSGPGNCLLDAWIYKHQQLTHDKGGEFSLKGHCNEALLDKLLKDSFFAKAPPKSTGRETFHLNWLEPHLEGMPLKPEDVQATLVELTAATIGLAIKKHFDKAEIYICGGGVHNSALMQRLQANVGKALNVQSIEALGMLPDWIESACFAWLAKQRLENQAIPLRTVTGSIKNTLLGGIFSPLKGPMQKLA